MVIQSLKRISATGRRPVAAAPSEATHDGCLGDRRVKDAGGSELLVEALGDAEGVAADAHVAAQDDDRGVALHLFAQRLVDGALDGQAPDGG